MKKFTNSAPFHLVVSLMKVVGIWPTTDKYTNLYGVYSFFVIVFLSTLHIILQAINCVFIYDDIELLLQILYILLTDLQSVIKAVLIINSIPLIKSIVKGIDSKIFYPKTEAQQIMLAEKMNFWKRVFNIYLTSGFICICFWMTIPLLKKTHKKGDLPFPAWYPHNISISPFYELTYIHQILSTCFVAMTNVAVDCLISGIMMFIAGQSTLLCDDLRNLYGSTKEKLEEENLLDGNNSEARAQVLIKLNETLIKCMKYHNEILSYAGKANGVFDSIAALQFVTSATVICMATFRLTVVQPYSVEFYTYICFEIGISFELWQYCWFGNEATLYSSEIPYAIYESSWMDAPIELKKNMVLFMLRAQKPVVFKALNFFDLSLATFINILKLSWSYFGFLCQVNAE